MAYPLRKFLLFEVLVEEGEVLNDGQTLLFLRNRRIND